MFGKLLRRIFGSESASAPQTQSAASSAAKANDVTKAGADSTSGETRAKNKPPEKLWRPAQPEFGEGERKKILACDQAEIQALSTTIIAELQASIDKIPPFPLIAQKLIEALESNNVRTDVVERLVTQDAVIAAKILQTANSPFYNPQPAIETLPHAIRVIGLTEVSRIAVAAATAAVFDVEERMAHNSVSHQQQVVWTHSVATARGSAWVALQIGQDVQRAYVAGLIHDIGKAVALRGLGMSILNGRLREPPAPYLVAAAIEAAHIDIGAMLADAWKLADHLGAVIKGHHDVSSANPITRVVELVSAVDELRTNPAHRSGLLGQVQAISKEFGVTQAHLIELELELKKAATAAGKL